MLFKKIYLVLKFQTTNLNMVVNMIFGERLSPELWLGTIDSLDLIYNRHCNNLSMFFQTQTTDRFLG